MDRHRADLAFAALLSAAGHAAAIGGLSLAFGHAVPSGSAPSPRSAPVVVLGADQLRAILEPCAPAPLPPLREAAPRAHAIELAMGELPHATAPAPAAVPVPTLPPDATRSLELPAITVRASQPEERLAPPPASGLPLELTRAAPRPPEPESAAPERASAACEAAPTDGSIPSLDAAVVIVDRPPLVYPPAALRRGIEGTVLVGLRTAADGAVERTWLLRSSGSPVLDRGALDNVRRWRFDPATIEHGRPFRQSVRFFLR